MARDRGIIYIYKDLPSRLRRDFSINRTTRLFTYVFAYVIRSSLSRLGFFVAARVLQPCGNSLEISKGESTTSRRGKTDDPFLEGRREREGYRFVEVCSREIAIEINIEKFSKLFELRFFFQEGNHPRKTYYFLFRRFLLLRGWRLSLDEFLFIGGKSNFRIVFDSSTPETNVKLLIATLKNGN